MTLADPKPVKRKKAKRAKSARTALIHNCPCVVCHKYGELQTSPTREHHWITGRFSGLRTSNEETLPLCDGHHQGELDSDKIAIHRNPDDWEEAYGRDYDLLDDANALIEEYNAH